MVDSSSIVTIVMRGGPTMESNERTKKKAIDSEDGCMYISSNVMYNMYVCRCHERPCCDRGSPVNKNSAAQKQKGAHH